MNLLNLTKRPVAGTIPEDAQQMVNMLLMNALDQAGIIEDKAEFWESEYHRLRTFLNQLESDLTVNRTSDGKVYIRFDTIYESFDSELFEDAVRIFNLGAKIIELETKEENETNN